MDLGSMDCLFAYYNIMYSCKFHLPYDVCSDKLNQSQKKIKRPSGLNVHPLPKTIKGEFIFLHRCLVPPKFFPQRKGGFLFYVITTQSQFQQS